LNQYIILQSGALLLFITSVLYNWNIIQLISHKPAAP